MDEVRIADQVEADAYRDMIAAAPEGLAKATGLRAVEVGGALALMAPGMPAVMFNRVIGLGMTRSATEADVDALIAAYRDAGVRSFWVHLGPATQPVALREWLSRRGFTAPARKTWAKVVRGTEPPPAVGTRFEIGVASQEEAGAIGRVLCEAHGMPPPVAPWTAALVGRAGWTCLVARAGGEVVAAGMLFRTGPYGWLGLGGTAPAHRNQGAQGALMAARIHAAIAGGAEVIVTETGEPIAGEKNPSLDNMYRCGFHLACSRANLAWAG